MHAIAIRLAAAVVLVTAAAPVAGAPDARAQPAPTALPIVAEDVRIGTLAGTLVRPATSAHVPAVVIVSGSGPNDRDGRIRGFPAYRAIAEHLARGGIAALLLDRRGVGGSAGDWRWERIEDRAWDVGTAVDWLARHPALDPSAVGIIGHSQGGWVGQQVAAEHPRVAFLVLMAGPAEPVLAQILTDERHELLRTGHSPRKVEQRLASLERQLHLARVMAPVCRRLRLHPVCATVGYDPQPALARIRVPVLALFGELDGMVPPQPNISLLQTGLPDAGARLTVRVFPGANHQFWPAFTGSRHEYRRLAPGYVPGFLEAIRDWIAARHGAAGVGD